MGANGFLGEGLITMVLPQTNAMGNICEQIKGKRLNGTNKSCQMQKGCQLYDANFAQHFRETEKIV